MRREGRRSILPAGQALAEYALVLAVVMAALLAIRTYLKRGIQATVKIAADEIGEQRDGLLEIDYQQAIKTRTDTRVDTDSETASTTTMLAQGGRDHVATTRTIRRHAPSWLLVGSTDQ